MGLITLTTDFGSFYPAIMKATILAIAPHAPVIDITHDITPHAVREGAFILREAVKYFPRGTVHIAVVDPTVGSARRGLVIEAGGHYLVGPDNGLIIPAARALGDFEVMSIQMAAASHTFHGRDIFAPTGAHISSGRLEPVQHSSTFVNLDLSDAQHRNGTLLGAIVYIDRFGNCITNIPSSLMPQLSEGNSFLLNREVAVRFVTTYDEVAEGQPLLVVGSFELVEVAMNKGDAARALKLNAGDSITLTAL
ncbi:MAG: SAM hydrolase/SAM-dependent halogenase family protein [Halobacteriota archaeon]